MGLGGIEKGGGKTRGGRRGAIRAPYTEEAADRQGQATILKAATSPLTTDCKKKRSQNSGTRGPRKGRSQAGTATPELQVPRDAQEPRCPHWRTRCTFSTGSASAPQMCLRGNGARGAPAGPWSRPGPAAAQPSLRALLTLRILKPKLDPEGRQPGSISGFRSFWRALTLAAVCDSAKSLSSLDVTLDP